MKIVKNFNIEIKNYNNKHSHWKQYSFGITFMKHSGHIDIIIDFFMFYIQFTFGEYI